MTPAIEVAKKAKISFQIHQYEHDPKQSSFGAEASEKLGIDSKRVFKTLVVSLDAKQLAVAMVPVCSSLSMKKIAKAASAKKAEMADKQKVERTTGYVLGGVSPLGQKRQLPSFIDQSAADIETLYISAGKRGLEIELALADLQNLTKAQIVDLQA